MNTNTILDKLPCGYLEFNDDGIIIKANNRICSMLDYKEEQLRNNHVHNILSSGAKIFYQSHLFPMLRMEKRAEEIYLTLENRLGSKIPVLVNATRASENEEYINRCVMIWMERRSEYEDRILHAKQKVEETSDEREKMISMMTHELRNPLSVIIGTIDMLEEELDNDEDSHISNYLSLISTAGETLARLGRDILNFAQLETGYLEVESTQVELDSILDFCYQTVEPAIQEKKIDFEGSRSTDIHVKADKDRLQQIIINLLNNAVKYTDSGGQVRLEAETDDNYVHIHVYDSGIGIPKDKIEQIFTPFYQIKESSDKSDVKDGFGLGLSICKMLAEKMDGKLTVQSTHGEGSCFTLTLPLAEG